MFSPWYTINTTFTAPSPKWAMAKRRRVEEHPEHLEEGGGGDDAAWEAEALAAGPRDKKGVRVCCMSGIRQQYQNVNTQNERHRAGAHSIVQPRVARGGAGAAQSRGAGGDGGGHWRRCPTATAERRHRFSMPQIPRPQARLWAEELLGPCKDLELVLFFLYFHLWWTKEQPMSAMPAGVKEWAAANLQAPWQVELAVLQRLCPPSVEAFSRSRSIFVTVDLWSHCKGNLTLWRTLDVCFRYSGSVLFAKQVLVQQEYRNTSPPDLAQDVRLQQAAGWLTNRLADKLTITDCVFLLTHRKAAIKTCACQQHRSFSARLPSKLKLWISESKLLCETSFKIKTSKLKNEAFLRDFLQKSHFEDQKRSISARQKSNFEDQKRSISASCSRFEDQKRSISARLPS